MVFRMKPYYFSIKGVDAFLEHYSTIYNKEYTKAKVQNILKMFPDLTNSLVLDLASGGGYYSKIAYERNALNVVTFDLSPVCVAASGKSIEQSCPGQFSGIIADATYLPIRNESFDFIICIDLIEHLDNDILLLEEISRILSKKGVLLIATQNSKSLNYLIEALIQRKILGNNNWMGWDPTHKRFYSIKQLQSLLFEQNLISVRRLGTYFIPYNLAISFGRINRAFAGFLKLFLKTINQHIEKTQGPLSSIFGWGIILKFKKM